MSYANNVGLHRAQLNHYIFACILMWIQLDSNEMLEEYLGWNRSILE